MAIASNTSLHTYCLHRTSQKLSETKPCSTALRGMQLPGRDTEIYMQTHRWWWQTDAIEYQPMKGSWATSANSNLVLIFSTHSVSKVWKGTFRAVCPVRFICHSSSARSEWKKKKWKYLDLPWLASSTSSQKIYAVSYLYMLGWLRRGCVLGGSSL